MAAAIRQLKIERYRGIHALEWTPDSGINVLVGPADSGKSQILSAIGLMLAGGAVGPSSEYDYFERDVSSGFAIEALIAGIEVEALAAEPRQPPLFGLRGDGTLSPLPEAGTEPVLRVRVTGTPDLEVVHEIIAPSGDPLPFSIRLRRRIGINRVTGDGAGSRALRMSSTGLLGKQFDAPALRAAVQETLANAADDLDLPEQASTTIDSLREGFAQDGLPSDIGVGLASAQGTDLLNLLQLIRGGDPRTAIPVSLSGSGTQALLAVSLLQRIMPQTGVLLFEEPEYGLEPFKQRVAAEKLNELRVRSQVFVTTHSPTMLQALAEASVWRTDPAHAPVRIAPDVFRLLTQRNAEALFAPLPTVCEGVTEMGFSQAMIPHLAGRSLRALGIELVDGQGHAPTLHIAEALADAGMRVAMFADNENDQAGHRARVTGKTIAFVWTGVRNLEEAIAQYAPLERMQHLFSAAVKEERYLIDELRRELPNGNELPVEWEWLYNAFADDIIRAALARAMLRGKWFKTAESAEALGHRLIEIGIPSEIQDQLIPFVQALVQ